MVRVNCNIVKSRKFIKFVMGIYPGSEDFAWPREVVYRLFNRGHLKNLTDEELIEKYMNKTFEIRDYDKDYLIL